MSVRKMVYAVRKTEELRCETNLSSFSVNIQKYEYKNIEKTIGKVHFNAKICPFNSFTDLIN